jgi:hypothetical protein
MRGITLATSVAMIAFAAAPAMAANVVALAGDNDLVWVDSEAMKATGTTTITGIEGRLLGIDVRPANGMLYGLFADGTIATINAETGEAKSVSTITTMLPEGATATVDFNPAADRLRVMGSDGTSLRINVETGETTKDGSHAYAEGDTKPNVVAGAYTNSYAGTDATQLFNIDGEAGWLVLQNPPNDGVLNAVGEIGMKVTEAGFDIASDGKGGNEAWLMSGDTLYSVNLETGTATEAGKVEGVSGTVRDIAILPAM